MCVGYWFIALCLEIPCFTSLPALPFPRISQCLYAHKRLIFTIIIFMDFEQKRKLIKRKELHWENRTKKRTQGLGVPTGIVFISIDGHPS